MIKDSVLCSLVVILGFNLIVESCIIPNVLDTDGNHLCCPGYYRNSDG